MTAPIGGIGPRQGLGLDIAGEGAARGALSTPTQRDAFTETLSRVLNEVSGSTDSANDLQQRFLRGEPVEIHQVMAATEEAGIAVEMLVAVRDKVVDAYRQLVSLN
ncbi:MAG: flagellar hook-basal body complex protein FliE [Gemmatimonadaceae bacterium]